MIIASVLALLVPLQADSVSFTARAAPVGQVVADLAKQTNVALAVSPGIARETILVKADGVPLQTLLDKIAIAMSAEWQTDGDTRKLVASMVARNREAIEQRNAKLAALRKSLADQMKSQPTSPGTAKGDDDSPEVPAINRLLQGIDLTPIAAMGPGDRIVYATSPNQMQRRLPSNTPQLVAEIVKQHNAGVARMSDGKSDEMAQLDQMPDFIKKMMEQQMKPVGTPAKALLIVSNQSYGIFQTNSVNLCLYDADGNTIMTQPTSLNDNGAMARFAEEMNPDKAKKAAKSTPITYSPDSKALLEQLQGSPMSGMQMHITPELREKLMHPEVIDPLAYTATDELLSLAASKKKAMVACMGDSMMESINMMVPNSKQSVEGFEDSLKTSANLTETDGWMVVKPAHPVDERQNFTDRQALATLLKATAAKGVPSLDDIATFAQSAPSPMTNQVGQFYGMFFIPGLVSQGMTGITNWDAIRFYGSLTGSQRANLGQEGKLAIGAMTGAQRALWSRMVFGATPNIHTGEPVEGDPFSDMMSAVMGSMMGMSTSYKEEPTELLPNGLTNDVYLQVRTNTEPFASPVGSDGSTPIAAMSVLGPSEVAMMSMFTDDATFGAAAAEAMPKIGNVKVGQRIQYKMYLVLPENSYVQQTLDDNRLPADAPVVAFDALPSDFQAIVAKRKEALKKGPLGQIQGMMGAFGGMGRGTQP